MLRVYAKVTEKPYFLDIADGTPTVYNRDIID